MQHIVAQADYSAQPLADLKQWLAITGTRDDAVLTELLATAVAMCERFTGIAPLLVIVADEWSVLDPGLRHGILRLAAHHYRERDDARLDTPPAAVAALWRPFRRLRL